MPCQPAFTTFTQEEPGRTHTDTNLFPASINRPILELQSLHRIPILIFSLTGKLASSIKTAEETKAAVLELYAAINSRDAVTVHRLLAPDLEWWFHGPPAHQHLKRLLTGEGKEEEEEEVEEEKEEEAEEGQGGHRFQLVPFDASPSVPPSSPRDTAGMVAPQCGSTHGRSVPPASSRGSASTLTPRSPSPESAEAMTRDLTRSGRLSAGEQCGRVGSTGSVRGSRFLASSSPFNYTI